jgi:ABC-type uncharacterized transport system ATPase subunit
MNSQSPIYVESLHKSYGPVQAIRGIDFEVQTGEIFGLLGPTSGDERARSFRHEHSGVRG